MKLKDLGISFLTEEDLSQDIEIEIVNMLGRNVTEGNFQIPTDLVLQRVNNMGFNIDVYQLLEILSNIDLVHSATAEVIDIDKPGDTSGSLSAMGPDEDPHDAVAKLAKQHAQKELRSGKG